MNPQSYEPEIWQVRKDDIRMAEIALKSGLIWMKHFQQIAGGREIRFHLTDTVDRMETAIKKLQTYEQQT